MHHLKCNFADEEKKMTTKHTPGPWIAIESKADKGCFQIQKQINADRIYPSWGIALIPNYQNCDEANARLIAACPTIYEFAAQSARLGNAEAIRMLDSLGISY